MLTDKVKAEKIFNFYFSNLSQGDDFQPQKHLVAATLRDIKLHLSKMK